jgi:hypothetical protein
MRRRLSSGKGGSFVSRSLEVPDATCLAFLPRLSHSFHPATSIQKMERRRFLPTARSTTSANVSVGSSLTSPSPSSFSTCTYRMSAWHSGGEHRQRDMGERRR